MAASPLSLVTGPGDSSVHGSGVGVRHKHTPTPDTWNQTLSNSPSSIVLPSGPESGVSHQHQYEYTYNEGPDPKGFFT